MKKFLAIIFGALFVLSFAVSAFAIHAEIPSETQAVVAKGATQITLGGQLRVRGWYQDNIVGGLPLSSNSQAFYDQRVRLSVNAQVSPNVQGFLQLESESGSTDNYTWGNFNAKPTGLTVLEAWILYKGSGLFGFPAGLKIGHMPLKLGEGQFFDHTKFGDDAVVFFMDPTKAVHVGLLTIKFAEGSKTDNTDDLDGYVGLITYKLDDKNTVGANYTYLSKADGDFSHQNLGLHANGNAAGLGYKAEVDFQFGKSGDAKFKGYALMAKVDYKMDPATLRASAAMGSGDDTVDNSTKNFVTYLGADQNYSLVYEYRVKSTAGATATGLNNTTYFNIGADFAAAKDVNVSVDGYILRATKDNSTHDSKNAGWELDGKVAYSVAKNLAYQFDIGYFKAGKYYGDEKKGVTVVRHGLTLNF
ncbi:MAG: alginate export family protein [Nitrospirae bacterium]|nr:alginate export family protein [Nitrospirota bacterium]